MKRFALACLSLSLVVSTVSEAFAWGAVVGPRGGAAYRGPFSAGVRGPNGGYAVRGPYGGGVARGPNGGVAVRAPVVAPYRYGYGVVTPGVAVGVAAGVAVGAAAGYAASSPSYYPSPYYCAYPNSCPPPP